MLLDKITTNHAYLAATNYWTPLQSNETEEDEETEEANNIVVNNQIPESNKWKRRLARRIEKRMVIDSGATTHFCSEEMDLPEEGESNKAVYLPNGNIIRTTKRTSLPFRQLSNRAREAHVLPQLRQSLMSVNKLSEEGYTTIFHPENEGVTVHEKGTLTIATSSPPVLQGCKEKGDNLWTVSANEEEGEEKANNVYNLPSTKQSIRYLHAAAGFPVKSEWIKAIKAGNYVTWPELTTEAVSKHFPESDETHKGHMKQQRQNVRSTKVRQNTTNNGGSDDDECNDQIKPQTKAKDVYIKIYLANDTVHFDQTGRFPATSSRGNKYIMVLVEIDGNYIDAEPMKNKTEGSMIKAYLALWERLTATGTVKPTTHIMDNEASTEYKKVIRKNCTIQLVPPNNHRRNLAEFTDLMGQYKINKIK